MATKLEKFLMLSARQKWLCLKAWVCLPLVAVSLRLLGFASCEKLLASGHVKSRATVDEAKTAAHIISLGINNFPYRFKCLTRSLTLWLLLRREGIDAEVCLGVSKPDGIFEGHAWVEYEQCVLNDRSGVRDDFVTFEVFRRSARSEHRL